MQVVQHKESNGVCEGVMRRAIGDVGPALKKLVHRIVRKTGVSFYDDVAALIVRKMWKSLGSTCFPIERSPRGLSSRGAARCQAPAQASLSTWIVPALLSVP